MCIITRSKCNSDKNTTSTKINDEASASHHSLTDFLVKFVADSGQSIQGLHGCIKGGIAEPTEYSLSVFFNSIGGMSQLSYMQKLKCAMVVSDNFYRMLYRLRYESNRPNQKLSHDNPLEKIVSEVNSRKQKQQMR